MKDLKLFDENGKALHIADVVCRLLDSTESETMRIGYYEGRCYAMRQTDSGYGYPDDIDEEEIYFDD